jgi:hypothetical protein
MGASPAGYAGDVFNGGDATTPGCGFIEDFAFRGIKGDCGYTIIVLTIQ